MKNQLYYILIAIFCFSCGNTETSIEQNDDTSNISVVSENKSPEKTEIGNPDWLKEIVRKKTEKIQEKQDGFGRYKLKKYSKLNNSLSFSITNAFIDGVCDRDTLATYIDGKEIDNIGLEFICDADGASPEYKWTEYDFIAPRSFRIRAYRKYVTDASLIGTNGFLKDHDMNSDNLETKTDSIITLVKIEDSGKIAKQE